MPFGFRGISIGAGDTVGGGGLVGDCVGEGLFVGLGLTVGLAGRTVTSAQFQNCSGCPVPLRNKGLVYAK